MIHRKTHKQDFLHNMQKLLKLEVPEALSI